MPQNTLSTHLAILARAGLVRSERRGRTVAYRADLGQLRAVTSGLTGLDSLASIPMLRNGAAVRTELR